MILFSINYLLNPIIDFYLLYHFSSQLLTFKTRPKSNGIFLFCCLCFIPYRFLYDLTACTIALPAIFRYVPIFFPLLTICVSFQGHLKQKLISSLLFLTGAVLTKILMIICFTIILKIPFEYIEVNSLVYFTYFFLAKTLYFYYIELSIAKSKSYYQLALTYSTQLVIILTLNFLAFILTILIIVNPSILQKSASLLVLLLAICTVVITIFSVYLILDISKKLKNELSNKLYLQQLQMEMRLNDDIAIMVEKLHTLQYDMNNHIGLILDMVKQNDFEHLDTYLDSVCDEIAVSNEFIYVKSRPLMVLLNNKYNLAQAKQIDFQYEIQIQEIPIPDKDMCTLLANIIDNAIDATTKLENNRYLRLSLKKKGSQYLIFCENTYAVAPTIKEGIFLTTKKDASIHGIGMKNIHYIVSQYDGMIDITHDSLFRVSIILPL